MRLPSLCALFLCAALAGCDGASVDPEDKDPGTPLAYFASDTDLVARVDAEEASSLALLLGEDQVDLTGLFDSLGIQSHDVDAAFAGVPLPAPNAPPSATLDAQLLLRTRLSADALAQRLERLGDGTAYGDGKIFSTETTGAVGVVGSDVLAAQSAAAVRTMMDRAAGQRASLGDDADLARLANRLDGYVAGVVARDAMALIGLALGDSLANVLPATLPIESGALALATPVGENGEPPATLDVILWLQPDAPQTADALASTLNVLKSLLANSQTSDPATVQIFSGMQITTDAPDVRLRFTIPFSLLADGAFF